MSEDEKKVCKTDEEVKDKEEGGETLSVNVSEEVKTEESLR